VKTKGGKAMKYGLGGLDPHLIMKNYYKIISHPTKKTNTKLYKHNPLKLLRRPLRGWRS